MLALCPRARGVERTRSAVVATDLVGVQVSLALRALEALPDRPPFPATGDPGGQAAPGLRAEDVLSQPASQDRGYG